MAEDAGLVKGKSSIRGKVATYIWSMLHLIVDGGEGRVILFEVSGRARKRIAQALKHMKKGKIHIGEGAPDRMGATLWILFQHPLEIAKELSVSDAR